MAVQYQKPGLLHWLLNPLTAFGGWAGATGGEAGVPAYRATLAIPQAYQDAVGAGYQGTYDQFALQAQAAISAAQAGAYGVAGAPNALGQYLGVASQDPYTDAILGVIRLITIGGIVIGGVWVTFQILDRTGKGRKR